MKVNISYQSKEHKFVFVRTFCQANLRSVIFNDKSVTPAQASNINQAIDAFLKWAIEIADGLNYIHERGLIHRHLKLENILVCINLTSSPDFYSSVREPWPLSISRVSKTRTRLSHMYKYIILFAFQVSCLTFQNEWL